MERKTPYELEQVSSVDLLNEESDANDLTFGGTYLVLIGTAGLVGGGIALAESDYVIGGASEASGAVALAYGAIMVDRGLSFKTIVLEEATRRGLEVKKRVFHPIISKIKTRREVIPVQRETPQS